MKLYFVTLEKNSGSSLESSHRSGNYILHPVTYFFLLLSFFLIFDLKGVAQIQPGDTLQFWSVSYIDWEPATAPPQRLISATCQQVGDSCYVFTDVTISQSPSSQRLASMAARFDTVFSRQLTPLYGPIPDEIDRDPRVFILIVPPEGWTGYFDPAQEMADSMVFGRWGKHSSEREILYISTDAFISNSEIFNLVHEFGHMLHWGQDHSPQPPANPQTFWEDAWIDEAFAMFAGVYLLEDVTVPGLMDYQAFFSSDPDLPLIHFLSYSSYDQVKLWLTFMYEHYGRENFVYALIREQANGISGVKNSLNQSGFAESFEETFEHWVLANYLDNEQYQNGRYGYHHYNFPSRFHSAIHSTFPSGTRTGTLSAFAADYILCLSPVPAPLQVTFQGDSLSRFRLAFIMLDTQTSTVRGVPGIALDSLNHAVFSADSFGLTYDRLIMVAMNVDSTLGENDRAGYTYKLDPVATPIGDAPFVASQKNRPVTYALFQNYPNPFNPSTVISWQLPVGSEVILTIYNLVGRIVDIPVNEKQSAGLHVVEWDASRFAGGIYFYKIEAYDPLTGQGTGFVEIRKMMLVK